MLSSTLLNPLYLGYLGFAECAAKLGDIYLRKSLRIKFSRMLTTMQVTIGK